MTPFCTSDAVTSDFALHRGSVCPVASYEVDVVGPETMVDVHQIEIPVSLAALSLKAWQNSPFAAEVVMAELTLCDSLLLPVFTENEEVVEPERR